MDHMYVKNINPRKWNRTGKKVERRDVLVDHIWQKQQSKKDCEPNSSNAQAATTLHSAGLPLHLGNKSSQSTAESKHSYGIHGTGHSMDLPHDRSVELLAESKVQGEGEHRTQHGSAT